MLSNQKFLNSENLITLAFHKMQASFSYGATNYSPRRFENLLKYLTESDYTFVSVHDLDTELKKKSVLITFDDGYAHLFKHLPRFIDRYKIKPLIFIPTNQIGKSNSWDYSHIFQNCPHMEPDMLKELSQNGVDFGSHGHYHCDLTALTFSQLTNELVRSKNKIQDVIGKDINSISYPFGRDDSNVIEKAFTIGYKFGFTMKFPHESDRNLSIGRYPIYGFDTMLNIKQKINHGMFYQCERMKSNFISNLSGGTILLNKLRKR